MQTDENEDNKMMCSLPRIPSGNCHCIYLTVVPPRVKSPPASLPIPSLVSLKWTFNRDMESIWDTICCLLCMSLKIGMQTDENEDLIR
jgi:hypothetical protein